MDRQGGGLRGARCPGCSLQATRRHSFYMRRLQDLLVQGTIVELQVNMTRWQCCNQLCDRRTFADQADQVIKPYARKTGRVAELARLIGYAVGGRPAERLMWRLGMPQGDDRILRNLKHQAALPSKPLRVVGIDDWSWLKGTRYGTIVVDLKRREVVDVLHDRSAKTTAAWLAKHPTVEIVSRDRCGLYAKQAGEPHRRPAHCGEFLRCNLEQINIDNLSGRHRAARFDTKRRCSERRDPPTGHRVQGCHPRRYRDLGLRRRRRVGRRHGDHGDRLSPRRKEARQMAVRSGVAAPVDFHQQRLHCGDTLGPASREIGAVISRRARFRRHDVTRGQLNEAHPRLRARLSSNEIRNALDEIRLTEKSP
jgi:hypothetical protein